MSETQRNEFFELVQSKLAGKFQAAVVNLAHPEIVIDKQQLLEVFETLKNDAGLKFDLLLSVTAVDYFDNEFAGRVSDSRFELVYHLLSTTNNQRLRIKVAVSEDETKVDSLTALWPGANFMESEVWDMYGISFEGHPGLRRVLMYEEFKGFPLRKDYPVQGKQPRIPLRYPEVENTARLMQRSELVKINKKNSVLGDAA